MNKATLIQAADELSNAMKNWKLIENRGEFLIFKMPDAGTNVSSDTQGEQMPFWRFDSRPAAERFRNRKIVTDMKTLTGGVAA